MIDLINALNRTGDNFCRFALAMLLQSGLLFILLYLIDILIRKYVRAVFRYCIWLLIFVKLILPPTFYLPTGIGYWCGFDITNSQIAPEISVKFATHETDFIAFQSDVEYLPPTTSKLPKQSIQTKVNTITNDSTNMPSIEPSKLEPTSFNTANHNIQIHWQAILFLVWLVGLLVLFSLLFQRLLFVKSLIAQSDKANSRLHETLQKYCRQVGLRQNVTLLLSKSMLSPAACGFFKPTILMPSSLLENLSEEELKAVLIHELSHIKRGDLWVNFIQTVLQIFYFYNPFVWFANAVVRDLREKAVDEMVLTTFGGEAKSYSGILIDIAEIAFSRPHFSLRLVGVVESTKSLTGRIKHILSRPAPKNAKLGLTSLAVILIFAAIILPMANRRKTQKNLPAEHPSTLLNADTENNKNHYPTSQSIPDTSNLLLIGRDFTKIQDAINAAKYGDTIKIIPGVYEESLTLKSGISLEGEDANNVVVQCDMRVSPVVAINECQNVHIQRLTLKHYNPTQLEDTVDGKWPVVQIDNSSVSLNHLIVCDSGSQGIKIANGRINYDLVSIVDCNVYNNQSTGITVSGNGNVKLNNNIFADNKKSGIYFHGDADGKIVGNVCRNNAYGISIQTNAVVEAIANICSGNKYTGIWFDSKSPFNVRDNKCFDNGSTGIEVNSQIRVDAVGNDCRRNGINGIYLRNGVSGLLSENICAENKWHGISIDKYSRPHVYNNQCYNNRKCGIYNDGGMLGRNETYDNNEFHWPEVHMYLTAEDFNILENMASQIRNEKRRFRNGSWQLDHFYYAFRQRYGQQGFDDNIKLIEKWISKYPASATPLIALANALNAQAWNIRGSGYAYKVSPEAWGPFEQHLSKAMDMLKKAEKLNVKDPELYAIWIDVAMGLHKIDEIETAFKKGCLIEPTYYPLYYNRSFAYLPKWYGQPGQYEQIAAEAADSTKNEIGQSLYFLLAYRATRQAKDINQFKEWRFDYNRIKQGLQDFIKQFPECQDIDLANRACFMACAAGDKEDAKNYFMDIGDQWQEKLWKNEETFQKYKSWAKSKDNSVVQN